MWRPRQESNLHLRLRRSPFYPLNYGGMPARDCDMGGRALQSQRQDQIASMALSSPDWARRVKRWATR